MLNKFFSQLSSVLFIQQNCFQLFQTCLFVNASGGVCSVKGYCIGWVGQHIRTWNHFWDFTIGPCNISFSPTCGYSDNIPRMSRCFWKMQDSLVAVCKRSCKWRGNRHAHCKKYQFCSNILTIYNHADDQINLLKDIFNMIVGNDEQVE